MKKKFALLITTALMGAALVGCSAKEEPSIETTPVVDESITVEETTSEEDANIATEETEIEIEEVVDGSIAEVETSETPEPDKISPSVEKPVTENKPSAESKPVAQDKPVSNTPSTNKPAAENKPTTDNKPVIEKPVTENKPVVEESKPTPTPSTSVPEPSPSVEAISASDLFDKITLGIELPMQSQVDANMLSDVYGIDPNLLKSFRVQMPMISAHISEIGVFELNTESEASKVIEGIEKRAANAGTMLYPSLQEAYDNRQIVTEGNYILFVMDENADTIVANFKRALK